MADIKESTLSGAVEEIRQLRLRRQILEVEVEGYKSIHREVFAILDRVDAENEHLRACVAAEREENERLSGENDELTALVAELQTEAEAVQSVRPS